MDSGYFIGCFKKEKSIMMGSTDIRYINKNQPPASLPTYKLIKQKLQFVAQKTRRKTPENFPVSESMTAAKQ